MRVAEAAAQTATDDAESKIALAKVAADEARAEAKQKDEQERKRLQLQGEKALLKRRQDMEAQNAAVLQATMEEAEAAADIRVGGERRLREAAEHRAALAGDFCA